MTASWIIKGFSCTILEKMSCDRIWKILESGENHPSIMSVVQIYPKKVALPDDKERL